MTPEQLAALDTPAPAQDELVEALRDIADPKRLASHGDPAVLRNAARAVLAKIGGAA